MRRLHLILLLALVSSPAGAVQDVSNTLHNLSSSGPGSFKSLTVDEVCVFCHTPHNATPAVPLWNHTMSAQTYVVYGSTTLKAVPGQPSGKSRFCLACHDGTVALGALGNLPPGQVNDLKEDYLTGRASLGTDLADDHPISFHYDAGLQSANRQLANPTAIDLPLEGDQLQCTTCHDPHERDIVPFLQKTTLYGEMCTTCHIQGGSAWSWLSSSHANSSAPGGIHDPWAERKPAWQGNTVAENACFNCHTPHNAVQPQRLVKDIEEDTCFLCHDGNVAKTDIQAEVNKPSRHATTLFTGIHDPTEDFAIPGPPVHVECADCHNPHATENTAALAPTVPGPLLGVKGVDFGGGQVAEADNLYEVCFKCHADYNVRPGSTIPRQADESNVRLEFDLSNPSFHPIEGPGLNPNVPSLIPPLTVSSVIYCTDCHNNDSGPGAGGSGPKGPHGSIYPQLLERNYSTTDFTAETANNYALCYKCHDRNSILSDDSFKEHDKHIRDEDTPCSVCHDPHGVNLAFGSVSENSHLINFDLSVVFPNSNGDLRFEDRGTFRGACYLLCHDEDHKPETYP